MRENTAALKALPWFSIVNGTGPKRDPWASLIFPSVSLFQSAVKQYACTDNENSWGEDSLWIGLGKQSMKDFRDSGIAKECVEQTKKAMSALPENKKAYSHAKPAVAGSYWDTPSVLANLPLAARTRQRQKLKPLKITLAVFFSAGISAESIAPLTARLAHAIYNYTEKGGSVDLTIGFISDMRDSEKRYNQGFVGAKVNAADLSNLVTMLSPVGFRGLGGRMLTALCDSRKNSTRGFATTGDFPGALLLSGRLSEIFDNAEQVFKQLEIS